MGLFVGPILSGIVGATFGLRPVFVYTALLVAADAAWVAAAVPKVGGTDPEQPREVPSEVS
jgi:predicted MFS family arabinose efflux permease